MLRKVNTFTRGGLLLVIFLKDTMQEKQTIARSELWGGMSSLKCDLIAEAIQSHVWEWNVTVGKCLSGNVNFPP